MLEHKFSNHNRVLQRIARIRERLPGTITEPRVMAFMERRFKERFSKGQDPDGNAWGALKPVTVRIKQAEGSKWPTKPLLRTGKLRDSIQAIRFNATFQSNTGLGFRVGVTDPDAAKYGKLHDQGLLAQTSQRKFMGVGERDAKALTDLIRREVRNVTRGVS